MHSRTKDKGQTDDVEVDVENVALARAHLESGTCPPGVGFAQDLKVKALAKCPLRSLQFFEIEIVR